MEMWIYQIVFKIPYTNHIESAEVMARAKAEP